MLKTVTEYFAGIGLVRLGLEQAGWQVVYANDFDIQKEELYRGYFGDVAGDYDLRDIFEVMHYEVPILY